MPIRDFIRDEIFAQRLAARHCLVIYDPHRRYQDIALGMATARCPVFDASASVLVAREAATTALLRLASGEIDDVIVWVPTRPPLEHEQKQQDPFSVFAEIGALFPQGDGDDYQSICCRAKPDHVSEVNRLFSEGEPSFEMIDALDQGGSWPKLKTLLKVESAKDVLVALLVPTVEQEQALAGDGSWVGEAREFILKTLGHRLKTKGQLRPSIADELWQLLLFSEFAFDCQDQLPAHLQTVPHAGAEAKNLVYDVCHHLRKHDDHQMLYRENASGIETDLVLAERCSEMTRLGSRDTFAFEERFFLKQFAQHVLAGRHAEAKAIWDVRQSSIWLREDARHDEWTIALCAKELIECAQRIVAPKFPSLAALIMRYAEEWRHLDKDHRELEEACQRLDNDIPGLADLVGAARSWYFRGVESLQAEFVRLVEREGWPARGSNLLCNNQLFAKEVDPHLQAGERVAYVLVDSLRYELGVELEKKLLHRGRVLLQPVCAQLPTYTEVGMASLMPYADQALKLVLKEGKLVTTLAGETATAPATRLAYLKTRKGDQCLDLTLDDLLGLKKLKLPEVVRLLVVRTREIDTLAHDSPRQVLTMIPILLQQIDRGIKKLGEMGFQRVVVATDHGFILLQDQEAGNLAPRPVGDWPVEKTRCLLGRGQKDSANVVMPRTEMGISGEFEDYAAPRTLVPYVRGLLYYHEGLSLQECVLPCLSIKLNPTPPKSAATAQITLMLTYKQGKTDKVTSRRPVVDLAWSIQDLFAEIQEAEVDVDVTDTSGATVGYLAAGQPGSTEPGRLHIRGGSAVALPIRMEDSFSGDFCVRILDAKTGALLADLNLKTAYYE